VRWTYDKKWAWKSIGGEKLIPIVFTPAMNKDNFYEGIPVVRKKA